TPGASLSPPRGDSCVLFSHPDQHPSAAASDLVSFCGNECNAMDDSMSLAASDTEELSGLSHDPAPMDAELFRVLSKAVEELDLEWSPPEEPTHGQLDEWFNEPHYSSLTSMTRSTRPLLRNSSSSALSSVDGAEGKGYGKLPPLDESVVAHLCPPTAIGWKARAAHPSKPCRTTSALAGRAYSLAGQAALALHSMPVLQVYQAKLLRGMDESGPDLTEFKDLCSVTDLASKASLVVLECHIWLTFTEIKNTDKVPFLDSPVSPTGLFRPAVEGFAKHFTAAQKSSLAMRHFLPKRSSSSAASSHPKPAPTQQPAKPVPSAAQSTPKPEPRHRFRSARRYQFPKSQGSRPKVVLDQVPQAKRKGPSLTGAGPAPKLPRFCLQAPRSVLGANGNVFRGPFKHQLFETIHPLALWAEAWQAIPGVSSWVLGITRRVFTLQFTCRRFSGVVSTSVQGKDAGVLHTKVRNLLAKGAVETFPPAQSESGFYSHYFLVPKKDGGLRPILNLRCLNRTLMRRPFRMLTLKQILSQVCPGDWFCSLDLKDAYFHVQIAPHHRRFIRFTFEGVAYQYTALPFGLSLAPRTFTKCMDAALSPLRQKGMRILNYLNDWLILAQSEDELLSHRSFLLSHLSPSQQISFLETVLDSTLMRGVVVPQRALAIQQLTASFKVGASRPLKAFQKMLGLMASSLRTTHVPGMLNQGADMHIHVLNTISQARALSTRHLYTVKWSSPP
ncbi:hypothetical protein M9458_036866, partial [Cirrhinus mrigala]